jgi:hypothetical protein
VTASFGNFNQNLNVSRRASQECFMKVVDECFSKVDTSIEFIDHQSKCMAGSSNEELKVDSFISVIEQSNLAYSFLGKADRCEILKEKSHTKNQQLCNMLSIYGKSVESKMLRAFSDLQQGRNMEASQVLLLNYFQDVKSASSLYPDILKLCLPNDTIDLWKNRFGKMREHLEDEANGCLDIEDLKTSRSLLNMLRFCSVFDDVFLLDFRKLHRDLKHRLIQNEKEILKAITKDIEERKFRFLKQSLEKLSLENVNFYKFKESNLSTQKLRNLISSTSAIVPLDERAQ